MDEDVENYINESLEPPDCETEGPGSEAEQPAAIVPPGDPKKSTKPVKK